MDGSGRRRRADPDRPDPEEDGAGIAEVRYAKAMLSAGVSVFSVTAERPDGTRLTIKAGEKEVRETSDGIDAMLGIKK